MFVINIFSVVSTKKLVSRLCASVDVDIYAKHPFLPWLCLLSIFLTWRLYCANYLFSYLINIVKQYVFNVHKAIFRFNKNSLTCNFWSRGFVEKCCLAAIQYESLRERKSRMWGDDGSLPVVPMYSPNYSV